VGFLSLIVLIPQKVFDHPFYLVVGIPAGSVAAALTLRQVSARFAFWSKALFFIIFFALVIRYYLPPALAIPEGMRSIPKAGQRIQGLTKPDELVIVPTSAYLYYADRLGWSFDLAMATRPVSAQARHIRLQEQGYGDPIQWLEKLRRDGADYFVISDRRRFQKQTEFYRYVTSRYSEVETGDESLAMFDLKS
jgi:hypothetical protein